jgi:hypothetical protein
MGPFSQHFIFFITYEKVQLARLLVPGRLFQPSIMFLGEPWSLAMDHKKGASFG